MSATASSTERSVSRTRRREASDACTSAAVSAGVERM